MSADSLFSLQSCPTIVEALPRFLDGECGPVEESRVAQHLELCSRCRLEHNRLAQDRLQTISAVNGVQSSDAQRLVMALGDQLPPQSPIPASDPSPLETPTSASSGRWWSIAASFMLAALLFSGLENSTTPSDPQPAMMAMTLIRGDIDASGHLDWGDLQGLIDFLQEDGPAPRCLAAGDFDDDGVITIDDSVLALAHLTEGAGLDSTILYNQGHQNALPCYELCP